MKSKKMTQLRLNDSSTPGVQSLMMVWIEYDKRVGPGSKITLVGRPERWIVEHVYEIHELTDIKRGWNNNI